MTLRALLTTRARVAWLVTAVVLALAVGVVAAPWPATLSDRTTGDDALAAQVRAATDGDQRLGITAAVVDDGRLRQAGLGERGDGAPVDPSMPMEIGSVTKTLTASVFADLVDAGVVSPDDRVRDLAPSRDWRDGGVGDATLADLASHRSGLPKAPLTAGTFVAAAGYNFLGNNPNSLPTPDSVFSAANRSKLLTEGKYAYSNLGVALLGQLLAEKTGTPYPELVRERLLDPVGMRHTTMPGGNGAPFGYVPGHDGSGRQVEPWLSAGEEPAGTGVWSTPADLARFADAVMRGDAPGADAARPRFDAGDVGRIGYAWHTSKVAGDRTIVWHNGVAGGCSSFVAYDAERQRIVAVLSNTDAPVDDLGRRLLTGAGPKDSGESPNTAATFIGIGFPLLAGVSMLFGALGGYRRAKRREPDRVGLLGHAGWGLFLFGIAFAGGALGPLSIAAWLAASALVGAAVFVAVSRWRGLAWNVDRRPWLAWLNTGLGLVVGVAVTVSVAT